MKPHGKYDLAVIARRLAEVQDAPPEGARQWVGLHYVHSVILSAVDFRPEIPEVDRTSIVWQAIDRARALRPLTAKGLSGALQDAENAHLRLPLRAYVIATSITLAHDVTVGTVKINDARIEFLRGLPRRFDRRAIQEELD